MVSRLIRTPFGALALALALFGASCSGSDSAPSDAGAAAREVDETNDSSAPEDSPASEGQGATPDADAGVVAPAELTSSFRGVTPEVIKVGITAVDWDTLAEIGVDLGRSNALELWEAALDDINARGGIHGRMLEIHGTEFLPVGSTSFDEACVRLTQDEEVFVVIGQALEDQVLCLTELNSTAALMVAGMADPVLDRSNAPYATLWASYETQAENLVALAEAQGVLSGATIGVVGSADVGVIEYQTIVDAFRGAGYEVVEGLIGDNGEDLGATARDQAIVYEHMKAAGVDFTVSTTGLPLEIFNAQSENWDTDQWLLTVAMTSAGLREAGVDLPYLDGALAVVNTPVGTSGQAAMIEDTAVAACLAMLEAGSDVEFSYGLDTEKNDLPSGLYACGIARMLEAALTAAGPDLTNDSFAEGLASIGPIDLPGYFGASLTADDLGAAKSLRLARFDASTGAWDLLDE